MTEQQIEQYLISKLCDLKYIHRSDVCDRATLEKNFREHFEALNRVRLTDTEFARLLEEILTPDVFNASRILRERNNFIREDGTPLTYTLVNIKEWCKNTFEVINQFRINTDYSHHRYDVMLLINGVPVVQIELKTLDISPRRAMQQIVHYKNDPGNGYNKTLLCFVQLFIVSNLNDTWYFANNNNRHFTFDAEERFLPFYQFASENNKKITHLGDFADKFLPKCTLGQMVSRYMVLVACEQKLMVMRPYQIYAVQAIVNRIHENSGNGYIWHTTGSGKTLTSFKASTLLKDNPDIEKCLFVVDRKDLDRQTREEFNKFQEGCVEENTNTESLVKRLLSDDYVNKVIVTTIQKLGLALNGKNKRNYKQRLESLRQKRIVFIFDECHRSQFGDNHRAIKDFFPNAQLFGFTGTPIFEDKGNSYKIEDQQRSKQTTLDIFQQQLHAYTITHAINDGNVLRFQVGYYKPEGKNIPNPTQIITKEGIIEAIFEKHPAITFNRKFNALLATASINEAIEHYGCFKKLQAQKQAEDPDFAPLNIACVFSPPATGNKDILQIQEDLAQEKADNKIDPVGKKKALKEIISDYNDQYQTNYGIDSFDLYYQDIQKRIKDQQYPNADLPHAQKIDIVIVVDMLLTGFDSKFLNTLYVDKNLQQHGLIQAFSRTNRVLNSTKPYGNIFDFRQQKDKVDEAIKMFAGEKTDSAKEIWLAEAAPTVIVKLEEAVKNLETFMQSQGLDFSPQEVPNLKGNRAQSRFITLFKQVQQLKTRLDQYTDLTTEDTVEIEKIIPKEKLQGFRGMYLTAAQKLKALQGKDNLNVIPEVAALDFEFVLFASVIIDYDYIISLLANCSAMATPAKRKMTFEEIIELIRSEAKLVDESEELIAYLHTLMPVFKSGNGLTEKEIHQGYEAFKTQKKTNELADMAKKHGLEFDALDIFVNHIMQRMIFDGEQLTDLMEPLGLGWKARVQKETALMRDLSPFLRKHAKGRDISGLSAYEQ